MLDDLGSYTFSDFLLFSQETYLRLFELYNRDLWPLHILSAALVVALIWAMYRKPRRAGRIAAFLIAAVWAWVGWAFHLERYSTINIAAPYFAALFGFESALFLAVGIFGKGIRFADMRAPAAQAGVTLVIFTTLVDPLIGLAAGRSWAAVEVVFLAPDPTAIATIGVLLAAAGRLRWLLVVPAAAWCLIAVLTAVAMNSIEWIGPAFAIALSAVVAVIERVVQTRGETTPP